MNRSEYYHTNKSWSNHCLNFLNELLQHHHKYLSHISALLIWWKLWGRGLYILASIILFYFFEQNMNLYSITKLWCFDARSEPQAMAPTWTKTNKQKQRPDVSERKYAYPPTFELIHSRSIQVHLEFGQKTEMVRGEYVIGKALHWPQDILW